MPLLAARLLLGALAVYAAAGVAFAAWFVPRAAGSRGFRILISPGVVALWPCLLRRR